MNKNRILVLILAISLTLACSSTALGATATPISANVQPNITTPNQDQISTFVAQTVEAQQSAATETPVPATVTPPAAAPALPNAPANFAINATCTKVIAHSYTDYKYVFTANMHWDDQSDNETSFEIAKDGNLLATLDANTTEYKDTFTITTPYKRYSANVTYTVQSINEAGKSKAVEVFVTLTCR